MSLSGLRVLRGPHWRGGEADGGEGHVGTVTQLLSNHQAHVLWDMGQETTCNAGHDGTSELRVFDTAQAGVRHLESECSECGVSSICGMLWRCQECAGCDLCSLCYADDKHDVRHPFLRIDTPGSKGQPIPKRKTSVKTRSFGTFAGAKVTRGKDWQWDDQDGGQGSEGEVKGYHEVASSPGSSGRNLVLVEWPNGDVKTYRLGFYGYVDLRCVEEELGPGYYRNHLPVLDQELLVKLSAELETANVNEDQPRDTASEEKTRMGESIQCGSDHIPKQKATAPTGTVSDTEVLSEQGHVHSGRGWGVAMTNEEKGGKETESDKATHKSSEVQQQRYSCAAASVSSEGKGAGTASPGETSEEREVMTPAEGFVLTAGARVAVRVGDDEKLSRLQRQCEGSGVTVEKVIGRTGVVIGSTGNGKGSTIVSFNGEEFNMNPEFLIVVEEYNKGDKVRIRQEASVLNHRVGWKEEMQKTVGKVGQVVNLDSDGDLLVSFGRQHFLFAPASCTRVTSGVRVESLIMSTPKSRGPTEKADETHNGAREEDSVAGNTGHPRPHDSDSTSIRARVTESLNTNTAVTSAGNPEQEVSSARAVNANGDGDPKSLFKMLREKVISERSAPRSESLSATSAGDLFSAARDGDHEKVRRIATAHKSLLESELQNLTPLMVAGAAGHRQVVRVLLDCGADVMHGIPHKQRSPLGSAMEGKDEDIVMMLLERGADPFTLDKKRHTLIHQAVFMKMPRAIKALAAKGVDVNAKDDFQDSALHVALNKQRHAETAALMAVPGLDLTVTNKNGFPIMHHACSRGYARALELILEKDNTQVHVLCHGCTPLHIAANDDHDDCVRVLVLNGGADVNIPDKGARYTPLHLACIRVMYRAAEALLELGANIQAQDHNGHSPLHLAIGGRRSKENSGTPEADTENQLRVALACFLISNGAVVDADDFKGRPPMSYGVSAVRGGVDAFIAQNPKLVTYKPPKTQNEPGDVSGGASAGRGQSQLGEALKGVGLPCGLCGTANSDVTLSPCQHKCVCSACSVKVSACPLCDEEVKDKVFTGADEQTINPNDFLQTDVNHR